MPWSLRYALHSHLTNNPDTTEIRVVLEKNPKGFYEWKVETVQPIRAD